MSSQVNKAALKVIDKAIRAVERKLPFKSPKARNEMLSYAADDMAEAYLIGAEEAQGEFLARLQSIRRTINAGADLSRSVPFTRTASSQEVREGSQPPTPLDACSTHAKGVSE